MEQVGFTQAENALLELAGGIAPDADLSRPEVFEIRLADKTVRIDPLLVNRADGPGYVQIKSSGQSQGVGDAGTIGVAEIGRHQVDMQVRSGNGRMPDILDAWGTPLMLWTANQTAGPSPDFALVNSGAGKARFYWASNAGIFRSSLGQLSLLSADADAEDRERSLEGLLGHPDFPDPSSPQDADRRPLAPLGETVVVSAGPDGVFFAKKGELEQIAYEAIPDPPEEAARLDFFDDLVIAGD